MQFFVENNMPIEWAVIKSQTDNLLNVLKICLHRISIVQTEFNMTTDIVFCDLANLACISCQFCKMVFAEKVTIMTE